VKRCLQATLLSLLVIAADARPASANDSIAAMETLVSWIRAFDVPAVDAPASRVDIGSSNAVSVRLLQRGRLVGRGIGAHDGRQNVRRAAGRALAEALADRVIAQMRDLDGRSIGERLSVTMELANALEPVPGRRFDRAAASFEPGLHGVAMRRGDRWAWRFPLRMIAERTAGDVEQQIRQCAIELDLPIGKSLEVLVEAFDVSLYRFTTVQYAAPAGSEIIMPLRRGDLLAGSGDRLTDDARLIVDDLAQHLLARVSILDQLDPPAVVIADEWLAIGPLPPLTTASERDTLLTIDALSRYAGIPGVRIDMADDARDIVRTFLSSYDFGTEDATPDVVALRVRLLHGWASSGQSLKRSAWSSAHVALERATGDAFARATPTEKAMLAHASALTLRLETPTVSAERVRELIHETLIAVDEPAIPTVLPWVGWAALDVSRFTEQPIPSQALLDATCERLVASQVGGPERPGASELVGGLDLVGTTGSPRAGAQATRPAAFLLRWLAEARPSSIDDVEAYRVRRWLLRFIRQLQFREVLAWQSAGAPRTVGGVRQAVWDGSMPLPAQALAMYAVLQTLEPRRTN